MGTQVAVENLGLERTNVGGAVLAGAHAALRAMTVLTARS